MHDADETCSFKDSVSASPCCASYATPRPHDLVWPRERLDLISSTELPRWASDEWQSQVPVVVRRERAPEPSLVPVGLRGRTRGERHAAYLHRDRMLGCVTPESLACPEAWTRYSGLADAPCVEALIGLAAELDEMPLIWGITGSVGFALATGIRTMRRDSDLDLLFRAPRQISREQAAEIVALLRCAPVRVDVQVETAHGAFALTEWAACSARVLLKTERGPLLVDDPWQCESIPTA